MAKHSDTARNRILDTAARLFYNDGFRATGIDKIVAESGVAKMSLYRNFASKDELISAYLDRRHDFWMSWFVESFEKFYATEASLSAIADALGEWFSQDDYRGCSFINVVAEGGSTEDDGHIGKAIAHKASLERFIEAVGRRGGLSEPEVVAAQTMVCIEGMIVRYQMTRDPAVVMTGRELLKMIERNAFQSGKANA